MLKELITSMRPSQWYKNLILFVGLLFSKNLTNIDSLFLSVVAFLVFCGLSAGEYLLNDIIDREEDRQHPLKKHRPIASGRLGTVAASATAAILIFTALLGAYALGLFFMLIALIYLLGALFYSLALKHIPFIDIITISALFVVRAWAGSEVIHVRVSEWLILCTFLLAMFLAIAKRRHELTLLGKNAKHHRATLNEYTPGMLDLMLMVVTSSLLMSYCLYTFIPNREPSSSSNYYLMLTIPFAIFGLFRYIALVRKKKYKGDAEIIFEDIPLVINLVLWALAVIILLYGIPDVIRRIIPGI